MCGDEPCWLLTHTPEHASSPRVAGMSRAAVTVIVPPSRVPRVCGDEPPLDISLHRSFLSSPRVRG